MIKQGFYIGDDEWWVMAYYDICPDDLMEIEGVLLASGCTRKETEDACDNLSHANTGFTLTNYNGKNSIVLISHATSSEQMFDTITHEIKHLTEHISNYFSVNAKGEPSAYLQGEIGRNMWKAASMVLCPHCYCNSADNERRQTE